MMKSLTHRAAAKLSSALSFLGSTILPGRSSMAAPATGLTAPGADPANMTLENDRAAVSISGTARSSGQYPEPSTGPAAVVRARLRQFGWTRGGRHFLPNPTMAGSSSNHMSGELRIDMDDADADADSDAGLGYELRLSNHPPVAIQSSVGIVEQDEELDLELQLGIDENGDAPVSGLRAYLSFRSPLQAPYILFGLKTNITLALVNIKLIHELKLPGSTPTLPEGVLAAAAGIGLLASAPAIYLQVKNRRSVPAKVLSQISVISLVSSVFVNLSTRFRFEQYGVVNIVATSGLFLFIVGMVIHVGSSTAVY